MSLQIIFLNENCLMKMKMWQKENVFSQVHHEKLSVRKSKINNSDNNDAQRGQMWFSTIFEVTDYEYDISDCPRYAWCLGCYISASSSGVFLQIEGKSIKIFKFFPGVFESADFVFESADYICDCPRYTWCPRWHLSASSFKQVDNKESPLYVQSQKIV